VLNPECNALEAIKREARAKEKSSARMIRLDALGFMMFVNLARFADVDSFAQVYEREKEQADVLSEMWQSEPERGFKIL
jgi:hypothetical protein